MLRCSVCAAEEGESPFSDVDFSRDKIFQKKKKYAWECKEEKKSSQKLESRFRDSQRVDEKSRIYESRKSVNFQRYILFQVTLTVSLFLNRKSAEEKGGKKGWKKRHLKAIFNFLKNFKVFFWQFQFFFFREALADKKNIVHFKNYFKTNN